MSVRKVERAEALIPVRRRLIKAVFFLRAESRDLLTGKTSNARKPVRNDDSVDEVMEGFKLTSLASPGPLIQIAKFP